MTKHLSEELTKSEWETKLFLKYGKMFKLYGGDLGVWEEMVVDFKKILASQKAEMREKIERMRKQVTKQTSSGLGALIELTSANKCIGYNDALDDILKEL